MKKAVLLCGGTGSRLTPLTLAVNKHLLPIHDRPMVWYSATTLAGMGISKVMVICAPESIQAFRVTMAHSSFPALDYQFVIQERPSGITQAVELGKEFVGSDRFALMLGDNIFGSPPIVPPKNAFVIKRVPDVSGLGVWNPKANRIDEKPDRPASSLAVTGLYFYDPIVFDLIGCLSMSSRGEMEITDLNNLLLERRLIAPLEYRGFWVDAGTFENLERANRWASRNRTPA